MNKKKKKKKNSHKADNQNYLSQMQLRWILVSAIVIVVLITNNTVTSYQPKTTVTTLSPQAEICQKFKRGEVKATDVAILGIIPGIQDISTALQKVQIEIANNSVTYTDTHPVNIKLREEEAALNSIIQQKLEKACQFLQP